MRVVIVAACCLCLAGCFGHRAAAQLAANEYACGQAVVMPGADIGRISIAIRLNAIAIARACGQTIEGADAWIQSLPLSLRPTGSPTRPQP